MVYVNIQSMAIMFDGGDHYRDRRFPFLVYHLALRGIHTTGVGSLLRGIKKAHITVLSRKI
jgi:hypothetical protein